LPPDDWPALRLQLHPSVALQPLQWAVEAAWRALQATDGDPELPPPEAHAHTLLLWRRGLVTQWRSLDEAEAALLQALQAGEPFAALCELATADAASSEAGAAQIATRLNQWLAEGLLSGFST